MEKGKRIVPFRYVTLRCRKRNDTGYPRLVPHPARRRVDVPVPAAAVASPPKEAPRFAVGDVRHNSVKRVASAVGFGAMAIFSAHAYLAEEAGQEQAVPDIVLSAGSAATPGG